MNVGEWKEVGKNNRKKNGQWKMPPRYHLPFVSEILLAIEGTHASKHYDWKEYRELTNEKFRIDMHTLAKFPHLMQDAKRWTDKHIHSADSDGLSWRYHAAIERLRNYVNQWSKSGDYIEVYPIEFDILQDLPEWFKSSDYEIVEIGLNKDFQVCKIAYVCKLETAQRSAFVFLCVGMDRGVKTIYLTPEFKYRKKYEIKKVYKGLKTQFLTEKQIAKRFGWK